MTFLKSTVLLFGALMILLLPIKTPFNSYDEGFAVFSAVRLMNGDVPYKDFWTLYPAGQFYAIAAVFKVLGVNLLAARLYDTSIRLAVVALVYGIARRLTLRPYYALFSAATATLLIASAGFYVYPVFPSLALSLSAILGLLEFVSTERRRWLLLAGLALGSAAWFRYDIAFYGVISITSTLWLFRGVRNAQVSEQPTKGWFPLGRVAAICLAPMLATTLLGYGYLSLQGGLSDLWEQIVVFPLTALPDIRWKPYPPLLPTFLPGTISLPALEAFYLELLDWARFYLPLAIYGVAVLVAVQTVRGKRGALDLHRMGVFALVIFGMLLFVHALSRYDYIHIVPSSIIAFLVLTSLLCQSRQNLALTLVIAFIASFYFISPVRQLIRVAQRYSPLNCHSQSERAGCVSLDPSQEQAVEYVRFHTPRGEPIFVGNQRHDLIFVNDIGFYFLADRPSPTRYHMLHPGVATTLPVQVEIVRKLDASGVKWIVLVSTRLPGEPNASSVSSGIRYLDDFVRSGYVRTAEFGSYEIWNRAGARR